MTSAGQVRAAIEAAFAAALARVDPEAAVEQSLHRAPLPAGEVVVTAVGKAAPAMARAAVNVLGRRVTEGIVVSDHREDLPAPLRLVIGSHPLPDTRSLQAGVQLLAAAQRARDLLLVLVSGGASALAEVPVGGLTVADLASTNRVLLEGGVPIDEMNTVRRHLSRLKDGGLLAAASAPVVSLLVSDVVDAPPSAIGSGPTLPDGTTQSAALAVLDRHRLRAAVPPPVIQVLEADGPAPSPPPREHRWEVVADGAAALAAAEDQLADRGLETVVLDRHLKGDAVEQARRLVREGPGGVVSLAAGETTVVVSGSGRGGRNQHAALAAVEEIRGREAVFAALATDGRDGNSDNAGAIVDGTTAERMRTAGIEPGTALSRYDSATALEAAGDAVVTGPTGTNVGDLWFSWRASTSNLMQ